jgi:hypothetical protein
MAKAAIAAGTRKRAADITLGIARVAHLAAAERDAKLEPALRELADLSYEKAAAELASRGFGWVSYATVRRARQRLGISRPAPDKAARKAEPRRRRVAQKAHEELAATE